MRISKDLTLNELLTYKLERVVDRVKNNSPVGSPHGSVNDFEHEFAEQKSSVHGHFSFLQYLEILLQNVEDKLVNTMPKHLSDPLCIRDLVYFGVGGKEQGRN